MTEARKSTNNVSEIKVNDQVFSQFDEIKEEASKFFSELFTDQPTASDIHLLDLVPSAVTSNDNDLLNRIITMDELREAIAVMEEDRAPGPDGYNVNFISICWDIVKKDLLKMVRKSQNCSKSGGSTNSAFLALIPKEK